MVITTRFKEEPLVQCLEPGCVPMGTPATRTRERARAHVKDTGHTVRVLIEDVTIYKKGE